ncbi:cupin domain-containing protein [Bacillus cereus]|uniref:Cupin n=1 Tax=Bacillus anthracis TaxID=1392 RepID=A0A0J1HNY2_BACAN|nr:MULTISPECIES: cupin domain-containing protein [Bacillus]KLV15436.1 cupin [Bacillus anthracis]MDA2043685.1 cupin domain-containing protein [Bacillus cereus]MDA2474133.1 cupin domain-containing protein [Bacillus cereus]MDE7545559.1 cupin domain-containing protein [Bacillus cereus]MDX9640065.1 cupin domain-containing protein [Bacillus sp. PBL-C9]
MTSNIDYTSPSTNFTYDLNKSNFFQKDAQNYINVLGMKQLNTLENTSLLDIYLSTGNVVEPHIHQNAAELVYCISGSAVVSLLNPFTNQILNLPIKPGQVANIPQAWWHYEIATADNTHLLAIFDAPTPEVIFGSDMLRLTPTNIMAHTYCLDEQQWKQAVSPIQSTTVIGSPANCNQKRGTINPATQPPNPQQNLYYPDSYYFPLYWGY